MIINSLKVEVEFEQSMQIFCLWWYISNKSCIMYEVRNDAGSCESNNCWCPHMKNLLNLSPHHGSSECFSFVMHCVNECRNKLFKWNLELLCKILFKAFANLWYSQLQGAFFTSMLMYRSFILWLLNHHFHYFIVWQFKIKVPAFLVWKKRSVSLLFAAITAEDFAAACEECILEIQWNIINIFVWYLRHCLSFSALFADYGLKFCKFMCHYRSDRRGACICQVLKMKEWKIWVF